MSEIWSTVVSLIGAGAWIPWVIILLLKVFRKGKVDFHERLRAQIGYTAWGIVVILEGSLRALGADMFITKMTLSLTKCKDNSKHNLECWFFQPGALPGGRLARENWRSFYPTMVRVSQPQLYGMVFTDTQTYEEMRAITDELVKKWSMWRSKLFEGSDYAAPAHSKTLPEMAKSLFEEFKSSKVYAESSRDIDKLCYWDAGQYSLEMTVQTHKPNAVSRKKWQFEITKAQAKTFMLNIPSILEEVCGLPQQIEYASARVKLVEADDKHGSSSGA